MATTVHIHNISPQTTEPQVRDFFSFCGKIASLSLTPSGDTQSSSVTFEKPTAAKTALLLDNTQLGPNLVQVTSAASLDELSGSGAKSGEAPGQQAEKQGGDPSLYTDDVEQEDKPRSRILAEYLAHGYTLSDKAIERGIALDQQHGISQRFTTALSNFDQKYKASEKAAAMDKQYGVSEKAATGWRGMTSYFEKAIGTPTGQRVHQFYQGGSKQVLDVHNEARRLANLKSGKPANAPTSGTEGETMHGAVGGATSGGEPSAYDKEKAQMHTVGDQGRTACNCGGDTGNCPCEAGKCACGTCAKNPDIATK